MRHDVYFLKRLFKLTLYKSKYKNIKLKAGSYIGSTNSKFEGYNVIGNNSFFFGDIGYGSYIGDNCKVSASIGRFCSIGNEVITITGTHPLYSCISTHPSFYSTEKQSGLSFVNENYFNESLIINNKGCAVDIGNDVWIGDRVTILGGIRIEDGAVLASGSVVTKDVEAYSVVGGVPAKVIKKRFSDEQIKELIEFEWWNKDAEWIKRNAHLFRDVESFFDSIKNGRFI